jgi:MFS family permease
MTSLSANPLMVALVQAAPTLPMFVLALPAGALADIVDRRKLLIGAQLFGLAATILLALSTFAAATTAGLLLAFTAAISVAAALSAPTFQAIVPELVPSKALEQAVALNSLRVNIARAIGPALGGVIIAAAGTGAVFALNSVSVLGVITVLVRWRRDVPQRHLPARTFRQRNAGRHSLCAARVRAADGAGPLGRPGWVKARALAAYLLVFQGSMSAGSTLWGATAARIGVPASLLLAAAALVAVTLVLALRFSLDSMAKLDLASSAYWPAPLVEQAVEHGRGSVLVTIEYRVDPMRVPDFFAAMQDMRGIRSRDGAIHWGLYEDVAERGLVLETFTVESWLELLRQHDRVTNTDRVQQDAVRAFQSDTAAPVVRHLIAR